ncbi:hypothetical protein NECAME_12685, partial [Necator americanus]
GINSYHKFKYIARESIAAKVIKVTLRFKIPKATPDRGRDENEVKLLPLLNLLMRKYSSFPHPPSSSYTLTHQNQDTETIPDSRSP